MEASARAEIAVETLHEHGISFGEAVVPASKTWAF